MKEHVVVYIKNCYEKPSKNSIPDFSTSDRIVRGKPCYNHGKNLVENKKVSHNYRGIVETDYYRVFKATYLIPSLEDKDKENNHDRKELLLILIIQLEKSGKHYVRYNKPEDNGFFDFLNRHGTSGKKRGEFFVKSMSELSGKVFDALYAIHIESTDLEMRLIKELTSFVSKARDYVNFSGDININKNSCLFYIIRGLDSFYKGYGDGI